jgi:type I restriction enzyme M protein
MRLTQQQLEAHLWGAANILWGKTAGQDYKNYILSLMFYKRVCVQWELAAGRDSAKHRSREGKTMRPSRSSRLSGHHE